MNILRYRWLAAALIICICLGVFSGCGNMSADRYTFTTTEAVTDDVESDGDSTDESYITAKTVGKDIADVSANDRGYAVSSSNDYVTQVGMSVLEAGGNAVDAAVAMGYMLGVVEPFASGLGGSGGMLIYDSSSGETVFLDYRAAAGSVKGKDLVGIPGFTAGMQLANDMYGTISMYDLIGPAVYYAENGFTVNDMLASTISNYSYLTSDHSEYQNSDGRLLKSGETMYQPVLAETLKSIQESGTDTFYDGNIADDIAAACTLSAADLAGYEAFEGETLSCEYNGYTVYSAGAPFSGLMLLEMLKMSEMADMADPQENVQEYLAQLSDITAAAQADRYDNVADIESCRLSNQALLNDTHIARLLKDNAIAVAEEEQAETTSYTVIDSDGLAVAVTNTLSDNFGSGIYVDGFWLNDSNGNFSASGVNAFSSGKRSRTFTAPTIVTGEDGFVMALGTPGGSKIPGILFQVITRVLGYGEDCQEAVDALRYIYSNGKLYVEFNERGESAISSQELNHEAVYLKSGAPWGSVAISGYSEEDGVFAAYDSRRGATFAGTGR